MLRRCVLMIVAGAAAALTGCWPANVAEDGLRAELVITAPNVSQSSSAPPPGAQFFLGKLPTSNPDGLKVTDVESTSQIVYAGEQAKAISGRVQEGTQVIAIGLDGDTGYWVFPVGAPDALYPPDYDFTAQATFSNALPLGNVVVHYEAGDGKGHFGPSNDQTLVSEEIGAPAGQLIVHLTWDTESDLDLHVVEPDGTDIWPKNQSSYMPPPVGSFGPPPMAATDVGVLQFDSNGSCVIDGKRAENAYWADGIQAYSMTVPTGTYTVRVDAWSMCGQTEGNWKVWVEQRTVASTCDPTPPDGGFGDTPVPVCTTIASASGTLYPFDTVYPHTAGSGAFALTFTVK